MSEHKLDGQEISKFVIELIGDLTKQGMEVRVLVFGNKITRLGLSKKDRDINRRVALFR